MEQLSNDARANQIRRPKFFYHAHARLPQAYDKYFENRKIIVWAASAHNIKQPKKVEINKPDNEKYKNSITMGEIVSEHFKNRMYSIAFTAYEGKMGFSYDFAPDLDIQKAEAGSFEYLCQKVGQPIMYIDFKTDTKDTSHWMQKPIKSRPMGYEYLEAIWPEQFDAMIYFDTVFPSAKIIN